MVRQCLCSELAPVIGLGAAFSSAFAHTAFARLGQGSGGGGGVGVVGAKGGVGGWLCGLGTRLWGERRGEVIVRKRPT